MSGIADEGLEPGHRVVAARHVAAALSGEAQRAQQQPRRQRGTLARQVDHRCRQHDAIEPALARVREPQQHRAAHRMRQREIRRRAIRHHHLLHEGLDVDLVVGERAHIALAGIAQPPRGMALAAPVDHRHREAAVAQVPHRLEILLDHLAAAGEHADRALAARGRRPARKAQLGAIRGLDGAGDSIFGDGIGGNGDKRHGRPSNR